VDQKYLESFEMWCWRRKEKINWTDRVRNEELLQNAEEQRNVLHKIEKKRLAGLVISCCLLKQVTKVNKEGKIEVNP